MLVSMAPQFYTFLSLLILLYSGVRIVWRKSPKADDRELLVAFIRLDFPPEQREVAQKIAVGLAEIVGPKIKGLRPEHTLAQIGSWVEDRIYVSDIIKILNLAYGITCDADTTFRALVERVVEQKRIKQSLQT
jgi:hypothetical protein